MSVFSCDNCNRYVDSDYEECFENPKNDCGLLCESCVEDIMCAECLTITDKLIYPKGDYCGYCTQCMIERYRLQAKEYIEKITTSKQLTKTS